MIIIVLPQAIAANECYLNVVFSKLTGINEVLVQHVKEQDELNAEKCVIAKHISQLTRYK